MGMGAIIISMMIKEGGFYQLDVTEDIKAALLGFIAEYCKKYPNTLIVVHGTGHGSVVSFESNRHDRNKRAFCRCKEGDPLDTSIIYFMCYFISLKTLNSLYQGHVLEEVLGQESKWIQNFGPARNFFRVQIGLKPYFI